jgi:RND superfamily putative drug exporter
MFVDRRFRAVWMVTAGVLIVFAAFSWQLKADGVAQSDLILGKSEAREGQKILSKHFPAGSGSPAQVVVPADMVDNAVSIIDDTMGVNGVSAIANDSKSGMLPLGDDRAKILREIRTNIEAEYEDASPQMKKFLPPLANTIERADPFKDASIKVINSEAILQVTLSDAADGETAKQTIQRLRTDLAKLDSDIKVGGPTAVQLDTLKASIRDRAVIIPVVLLAITLILMVLLRSIIAPIILLLSTGLSFGATLGVAALLFNHVFGFPGADPSVVLFGFVFLVALGIDYNIFLMTRVREETLKQGTAKGVIKGLIVTGGVITSAGIVLAATFAALGVIPILFLFQIAFIVAFGVLLDTFLVRSLLVPALIRDIGPFVWWPSRQKK